ncbi:hypothetical protein PR202_ga04498 [Eleusine coracana subsp. coracana]|uniref:RBR-type E3 ubiquitin transferase n=1 Tax=Eleusine coracana subsp. coracana TaxID=191504 RepID=A0AAV5BQ16_ELECO|nr:hypothetical protein PR202_ga04498 [Eleusine coracana subsp. coracana]
MIAQVSFLRRMFELFLIYLFQLCNKAVARGRPAMTHGCSNDGDLRHLPGRHEVEACAHRFCVSCMERHVRRKLLDGALPACPRLGCGTKLTVEGSRSLMPPELQQIMAERVREGQIPPGERVYCPYPKCSVLMSMAELNAANSKAAAERGRRGLYSWGDDATTLRKQCVRCGGAFCVSCRAPWHARLNCTNYQLQCARLHLDDAKLQFEKLAQRRFWRQCTRCGERFCYRCGKEWDQCSCTGAPTLVVILHGGGPRLPPPRTRQGHGSLPRADDGECFSVFFEGHAEQGDGGLVGPREWDPGAAVLMAVLCAPQGVVVLRVRKPVTLVPQSEVRLVTVLSRGYMYEQIINKREESTETCGICLEETGVSKVYAVEGCGHLFCISCMKQHVKVKLLHGALPGCPHDGCKAKLTVKGSHNLLTPQLCRSNVGTCPRTADRSLQDQRIYCPLPQVFTFDAHDRAQPGLETTVREMPVSCSDNQIEQAPASACSSRKREDLPGAST